MYVYMRAACAHAELILAFTNMLLQKWYVVVMLLFLTCYFKIRGAVGINRNLKKIKSSVIRFTGDMWGLSIQMPESAQITGMGWDDLQAQGLNRVGNLNWAFQFLKLIFWKTSWTVKQKWSFIFALQRTKDKSLLFPCPFTTVFISQKY